MVHQVCLPYKERYCYVRVSNRLFGKDGRAKIAVGELLKQEPDFKEKKEKLIKPYIKVDTLVKKLINGLKKAGLDN